MPKDLSKKILILILINLLVKPVWLFGIERGIQITTGFEDYGLYYTLFNFTILLGIISDLGIHTYNTKWVSQNSAGILIDASQTFTIKIFISAVYFIIALISSWLLGYSEHAFLLLLTLIIYQLGWSFLSYLRTFLTGLQQFKSDTFISVLDKLILIIVFIPLIYIEQLSEYITIQFFASMQIVAISISIFTAFFLLPNNLKFRIGTVDVKECLQQIKDLLPYTFFMMLVLGYNRVDSLMLEWMLIDGAIQNGHYAAAYRLLDAVSMVPMLVAYFILPVMSKIITKKESIKSLIAEVTNNLLSFSIILAVTAIVFRDELMIVLYGSKSNFYLVILFSILVFNIIFISMYYIFSTALTANGNLKQLNTIAFSGLILNIFLNLILIPNYKALGAAIATVLSLGLINLGYLYFFNKVFGNAIHFFSLLKIVLLAFLMIIVGGLIYKIEVYWIFRLMLLPVAGIIIAFVLQLFSLKKLISFTKFTV